ncbi:MAG: GNAT family N-acetyltransferase [Woeseiaceae bacterium]|nr:GNAT family N-acetyltransferase [Woeseiaceae bacterium]
MNLTIRMAEAGDAETIARFNNGIAEETEGHSLDPAIIGSGVKRLLADPDNGQYWVAETDGQIVGQIMVTYEWSDWRDGRIWWIQSVYVDAEYRRKGVFASLYRHVQDLAKKDPDAIGIRLYVDSDNARAQDTYVNLGMQMTAYRVMETMFDQDRKKH